MDINEKKRELQEGCVQAFIDNDFYGGAILPTGSGKTWIMLKCLSELFERDKINSILYTCNSINLRDTDFPDEVRKWGYSKYLDKMDRLCYQSAYKLEGQHYDVGLIDEGDFCLTEEYIKLLLNNSFKYLIFVSATLEPDKLKLLKEIEPKIPIIYKKELNELEDDGILNKSKYHYVNYLLSEDENKKYIEFNGVISRILNNPEHTDGELRFAAQQRKLFMNRLKSSELVCKNLLKEIEGRTLIFSELTSQIDKITKYTYHGKNSEEDNLNKFNNLEIDKLGVVGKINRGVNLINVQNIVKESCSSSKTNIVQQLGRGKRLEIDEFLNVYLLVPYYKAKFPKGSVKPTIVLTWLEKALKDFNIKSEVYKFKK